MRWEGERESTNVEDRRGDGGGGGGGGFPIGRGGIGIGTVVVALVAGWIFGINPLTLLGMFAGGGGDSSYQAPAETQGRQGAPDDAGGKFAAVVLASTEDVWTQVFQRAGARYTPPTLVLYNGGTRTGCGTGSASAGPFYCPEDRKVYIDLSFYRILKDRLGAPGEAAQAYVIAHEVGHHIQNLAGTMDKVEQARRQMSAAQYNQISVRLELQADCYAGVWAYHSQESKKWLDAGDIEQAINAAAAVGDDRLQQQSQGVVRPESFTHGSSAQRVRWFKAGAQGGDMNQCDTFARNAG